MRSFARSASSIALATTFLGCPHLDEVLATRAPDEAPRVAERRPAAPPMAARAAEPARTANGARPEPAPPPAPAPAAPAEPRDEAQNDPAELDDPGEGAPSEERADPRREAEAAAEPPLHELASRARETWVFAEPSWSAKKLGYLRAGAIVLRDAEPRTRKGCEGGWYRVRPAGYVCVGESATLNIHELAVHASRKRPRLDGLPYVYAMSRNPPPPVYGRLPSPEEQREAEPDLGYVRSEHRRLSREPGFVPLPELDPTPDVLLYGRPAPGLGGDKRDRNLTLLGRARPRTGFALLSIFDHEDRPFGLTTDLDVVPLDRTRIVKGSAFSGVALAGEAKLPVAFVRRRRASAFLRAGARVSPAGPLAFREALPLTGERSEIGGTAYLEAEGGRLVREDDVVRVDPPVHEPSWAASGRKWIDISILKQTLVAYEGRRPVFATLVSTGKDGLGDPAETHSTVQGTFLIHTKHVTVTMDGDEEDEFDFRDVPFVQYFHEGYALHAAYWHDEFGTPRSHGCVNLAPKDAAWLFAFTTPDVPEGWHAALSLRKGTLVHIHP